MHAQRGPISSSLFTTYKPKLKIKKLKWKERANLSLSLLWNIFLEELKKIIIIINNYWELCVPTAVRTLRGPSHCEGLFAAGSRRWGTRAVPPTCCAEKTARPRVLHTTRQTSSAPCYHMIASLCHIVNMSLHSPHRQVLSLQKKKKEIHAVHMSQHFAPIKVLSVSSNRNAAVVFNKLAKLNS